MSDLQQLDETFVFAELRSACAQQNYEKAHHCLRWFLLYGNQSRTESALHYAIHTVHADMINSYKWPWWLAFIQQGKQASLTTNSGQYFRILNPEYEIIHS